MRIKLKFGEMNARMLCQYTAVAEVASQVFGKGDKASSEPVNDLGVAPTYEAAIANINAAMMLG